MTGIERCVAEKAPVDLRAGLKHLVMVKQISYKQAALKSETKLALAERCEKDLGGAKITLKSFGCDWNYPPSGRE